MLRFSPASISALMVIPLRYLFSQYGKEDLLWDPDPKKSKIEIDTINNFHKIKVQAKPRLLVSRGQYSINPTGLTDNMAEAKSSTETKGLMDRKNLVLISGVAQILIEANQEGTCEKIVDMTQHFITWLRPVLCDTQGFKELGQPMSISSVMPNKEDIEIFQATINIPWTLEETWSTTNEAAKIKDIIINLV